MSVIALETEVVGSRLDKSTRTGFYTIQRDGKRWTVAVPFEHFEKHKRDRQKRRNHLATVLTNAMRGKPDEP